MRGSPPGEVSADGPSVVEIDREGRLAAAVNFDSDDIDAAFDELDARYLAGEAAAYAHAWSVISRLYAGFNRHALPATTPDWTFIDRRRLITIEASDLSAFISCWVESSPDISIYMEAVHRLSDLGAVVTHTARGASREDFDAEWRMIDLYTVEGELISRLEMFDEADLDAALARFDELNRPPLLDNAATRALARAADAFNRRDVDSFFALMTADGRFEDRRKGLRVVLEGAARRKAVQAIFDEAPSSWRMQVEPIAIRGSRLELTRECYCDTDEADRPIAVEFLHVMEVSDSGLVQDIVSFDPDDIDAAFAELDARYLAGEAVAHAHTWSVIAQISEAFNRHEFPSADWVIIDNRRGTPFAPRRGGDTNTIASTRAVWDLTPDLSGHIEAVHRQQPRSCCHLGGAWNHARGLRSRVANDPVLTVEGDLINRCELFDEADVDAALARFDELDRQAPLLENAATRAWSRLADAFNRRDLDGVLAAGGAEAGYEDRRKAWVMKSTVQDGARLCSLSSRWHAAVGGWRWSPSPSEGIASR